MAHEKFTSDGRIRCVHPGTGEEVGSVPVTLPADVEKAARLARVAQGYWSNLDLRERVRVVEAVRDRLHERADLVADVVHRETGKPRIEAFVCEVVPSIELCDYYARHIESLLASERIALSRLNYPGKKGWIIYRPLGLVALLSPWNYPVAIPLRTLIPGLLAGNAFLFKPSEYAALTGQTIGALFEGLVPRGLLSIVQGGPDVGQAVVAAGAQRIVFTGSVATGRKVAVAAAERLIPASLELGGKDAAIVLADCDLERAVQGIVWGAFTNCGQNCASVERVFVERSVADAFTERVVALTRTLRFRPELPVEHPLAAGDSANGDEGLDVGPLINEAQLDKVRRQLRESLDMGARILVGGEPGPEDGLRFPPTVVADAKPGMALMQEETFGPILPIVRVQDADEAVKLANDCKYGLTASIWTRDLERARALAQKLETGVVTINNHGFTAALPNAPWTGVKETGHGVTNSRAALMELVRPSFLLEDRNRAKRELWWYPYSATLGTLARGVHAFAARGFWTRLVAALSLLGPMGRRIKE